MFVNKFIKRLIPIKFKKLIKNFWILSETYAQRKSIMLRQCLDRDESEIPWYTYPAIEYLKSLDFSKSKVLEYGSGASSAWWAKKAIFVLAVEDNKEWFEITKKKSSTRLSVVLAESEPEYLSAAAEKKFDVVIIDGVYRHRCAELIPDILDVNGLVILDNSDWYPETAKVLRDKFGLLQVDFHGFGPINDYTWTTSLFFARTFICRPSSDRLPSYSLGALVHLAEGQGSTTIMSDEIF